LLVWSWKRKSAHIGCALRLERRGIARLDSVKSRRDQARFSYKTNKTRPDPFGPADAQKELFSYGVDLDWRVRADRPLRRGVPKGPGRVLLVWSWQQKSAHLGCTFRLRRREIARLDSVKSRREQTRFPCKTNKTRPDPFGPAPLASLGAYLSAIPARPLWTGICSQFVPAR